MSKRMIVAVEGHETLDTLLVVDHGITWDEGPKIPIIRELDRDNVLSHAIAPRRERNGTITVEVPDDLELGRYEGLYLDYTDDVKASTVTEEGVLIVENLHITVICVQHNVPWAAKGWRPGRLRD